MIIRGTALDLALSIEFVDGNGALIQSTDSNGLPPSPISLRNNVEPSVLKLGVTLRRWDDPNDPTDVDGYELRIDPVAFGINNYNLYDSISGTNPNPRRRVVIRTPFGTAIASPAHYIFIQN